jgi:hypothetical protein
MFLEAGHCALCGRTIDTSTRFTPHNVEYDQLASKFKYRPLFCLSQCIRRHLTDDAVEQAKRIEIQVPIEVTEARDEQIRNAKSLFDWHWREIQVYRDVLSDHRRRGAVSYVIENAIKFIKAKENEAQSDLDERTRQAEQEYETVFRPLQDAHLSSVGQNEDNIRLHAVAAFFKDFELAKTRQEASRPPLPTITDKHRFEHTHILGPQGSGKSTLIQELILQDLKRPDRPAIIVIDPKGFMVDRIASLKQINPDDLIIIDPRDKPAPPLNLFNVAGGPKVVNQAISSFDYVFAQAGASLSPLMRPAFRFCARLMFSLPDPSIFKLMDFLESREGDPEFAPYIEKLTDEGAKRFFKKDFYSGKRYDATKEQVKARFQDILSMPEVMAMFNSKAQPIDFVGCLQKRKIILVNTAFEEVGLEASQLIGRYVISLVLASAFARGRDGPPAFLYIDEFQDYVDEDATPRQLRMAREYNLGMILAHQQMFCNEFTESIRSSVSSTTVKYCSGVSGVELSYMLKDLRCEQEFLDQQVPDHTRNVVKFACAVKGHPASSVEITYPNITEDMRTKRARPTRPYEPPLNNEGSRGLETRPAEADKLIVSAKSTGDRGEKPEGWDSR